METTYKNIETFPCLAVTSPAAAATIQGSEKFSNLNGEVRFYRADMGTLVAAEIFGLPQKQSEELSEAYGPFYGFHIHEGEHCGDNSGPTPFMAAGGHYNPTAAKHPYHSGDMPPLLGNDGYAYTLFYTGRFVPEDIIGRTVIIHQHADDFHTQPSGNSGAMIACGEVKAVNMAG